jgi:4-hydroxyacetophenone monooxygenase
MIDEAQLHSAVTVANVPTLLAVLVHLTGDMSWLDERYAPRRPRGLGDEDDGGLAPEVAAHIRAEAARAIMDWQLGKTAAIDDPPDDLMVRILGFTLGEPVADEYGPMMRMDLRDRLAASLYPRTASSDAEAWPEGFSVAIIGAGPSGLAAGVMLGQAGIPYMILEKDQDVAGTWQQNRYPGAAVDTPSHLYSFSFAPWGWSRYFADRAELAAYLSHIADAFGVRQNVRFGREVVSARYDAGCQQWRLEIENSDSAAEYLTASVVITAVGALNRPAIPAIRGLASFAGPTFHTARWPEGIELAGKRIAVIGTGASAMQLVPAISDAAAAVVVLQRSPQWAAPFDRFQVPIPESVRALMAEVPHYTAWYRLRQAWIFNDKVYPSLQKDPAWPYPERSINAVNDAHREFFTRYISEQLGDRTDLLAKAVPHYPPFGKRMLLDNGWFRTLSKPNVHLVTAAIDRITKDRILTVDGEEHRVDMIVLATGFDALNFLAPINIVGRSGATLREAWGDDDGRAFLGLAVPDYPNLFCLYGPNTQTAHGGSLMYIAECQLRYILDLLRQMRDRDLGSVECRQETCDDYVARVDAAHERMIWTHPGVSTYYRNARGRVVMNSPWRIVDFWAMTRRADLADFVTEPSRPGPADTPE